MKDKTMKLDLQMFAQASAQLQNTTTASGMTAEMKTYYEKRLLDQAEPALVHDQFGDKRPIPKGLRQRRSRARHRPTREETRYGRGIDRREVALQRREFEIGEERVILESDRELAPIAMRLLRGGIGVAELLAFGCTIGDCRPRCQDGGEADDQTDRAERQRQDRTAGNGRCGQCNVRRGFTPPRTQSKPLPKISSPSMQPGVAAAMSCVSGPIWAGWKDKEKLTTR